MIRSEIQILSDLGPLPARDTVSDSTADEYGFLIDSIQSPVTDEEAIILVKILGPDEFYGLAWTLVHLIEAAPDWPIMDCLEGNGEWVTILRERAMKRLL